jgi:hypothetical protein
MTTEQTVMIYHYPNYKGEKKMVRVEGTILASYPSEHIYLVQTLDDRFAVYYGLSTKIFPEVTTAIFELTSSIEHAAGVPQ